MTNCKVLRKPDGHLNWDRIAHKLLEGWGHSFVRAVYDINNEWNNFIWRNQQRESFEFCVWDLLRFKILLPTKGEIEQAL